MSQPAPALGAIRSARFLPFFVTQLVTAFNDNFFKNAMILWISATSASVLGLSPATTIFVCHAVFILPFFLFSATAGQLADRHDKSKVVRAVKLAELAIMSISAAGFVFGSLPWLLVTLGLMGVHSAFLGPVKYGILPELLPPDAIVIGNAWVEMGTFLAILGGTIGGGLLILTDQGPTAVGVVVIALAVVGLLTSLRIPALAPASPGLAVQWDLVRPTLSVLRITARHRPLLNAVLGISWFWFVGTCFLSLFPAYARSSLGADESVVTVLLATFCIGIALGSMLTERISGPNLELALVPIGALGMSLAMLDLYRVGSPGAGVESLRGIAAFLAEPWAAHVLVDLAIIAVFGGLYTVPLYSFLAKRSPSAERARIVAGNNVLNALFMVAATGTLMALEQQHFDVPTMMLVVAGLNLAVALYIESVVPEFVLRFVAFLLSRVLYRLRVEGSDRIPAEGPAVVVCNHVSFVDWLVLGGAVRRPMRFVMDARIARTPLASIVFERGKTIPISPAKEDPERMEQAFVRIAAELRDGELVCIFPEGRLTADGRVSAFRAGIERIVRETPVPVIPASLHGLWGSMWSRKDGAALSRPPRRFRARLTLRFGEPVPPDLVSASDLESRVKALLGSEIA